MLLQLQTFCCGETRRKHLHVSLLWFCCFTGFFFLEQLSSHLPRCFCCWLVFSFLDMAFYHQRCKYQCLWWLNLDNSLFTGFCKRFFLPSNCKSFHWIFLFLLRPHTQNLEFNFSSCSCFYFSNLVLVNHLHGQTL